MSGSLKRALGLWIVGHLDGLHVYSDDLANARHHYPSCTIIELSHETEALGCGKKDYTVRDNESDIVVASGKMHRRETVFRLTFIAPSDKQNNGQEIVDRLLEDIESTVLLTKLSCSSFVLRDTETSPSVEYTVDKLTIVNRQTIPPDVSGEPFIYRGTISLHVSRIVSVEEPVDHVIKDIYLLEK